MATSTKEGNEGTNRPRVVVAGATGFVGRALGPALAQSHEAVGLTRSDDRSPDHGYRYRRCDLFSLLDVERALEGADYAVYLVHSMMPSARLTQGRFADMDLICADNFARAAASAGVRHIVYLSGLIPDGGLSSHLASRLEVERVLGAYGVPVTTLRAGMVIGAGGSSFQMLVRLVRRLPLMACPSWTSTPSQPVALDDVVELISASVGRTDLAGSYDIGAPEVLTYRSMMERTARLMGKRRHTMGVPLLSPRLSRLWVSTVTGAPRELVAPLVESLKHPMVAGDRHIYDELKVRARGFDEAVRDALADAVLSRGDETPHAFVGTGKAVATRRPLVRSVQRVALPRGRTAFWAAETYMEWLPRSMRPFIRVEVDEERLCRFYLRPVASPLLELRFDRNRSHPDRQLFYVVGGLLTSEEGGGRGRGRLEFRKVPGENSLLCAIHDFEPSLPWYLYRISQALVHLYVVWAFGRHLRALGAPDPPPWEQEVTSP
jgi:uncharacterized protein YbjT (DUF2867 family)